MKACDAAVAQMPWAMAILDSRAFVLLKLGRLPEAIATYDQVLSKWTLSANSLYGRGVAKRRMGDVAGADEDQAAALLIDARVREAFAGYGVEAP